MRGPGAHLARDPRAACRARRADGARRVRATTWRPMSPTSSPRRRTATWSSSPAPGSQPVVRSCRVRRRGLGAAGAAARRRRRPPRHRHRAARRPAGRDVDAGRRRPCRARQRPSVANGRSRPAPRRRSPCSAAATSPSTASSPAPTPMSRPMLRHLQPAVLPSSLRRRAKSGARRRPRGRAPRLAERGRRRRTGAGEGPADQPRRSSPRCSSASRPRCSCRRSPISTGREIRQRARRRELVVAALRLRDRPVDAARRRVQHARCLSLSAAVRAGVPAAVLASRSSTWPRRRPRGGSPRRCASSRSTACPRRRRSAPRSSTAAPASPRRSSCMAITFAVTDLRLADLGADRFNVDLRLVLIVLIFVVVAVTVSIVLIPVCASGSSVTCGRSGRRSPSSSRRRSSPCSSAAAS